MKLSLSKKQEEAIYILRLEGLRRQMEYEIAKKDFTDADNLEKSVGQYVIDNNEFYADCPDMPEDHGKRITDEFSSYLMNDSIFESDYLPKIKDAYMKLHMIDNPLNFVYSEPYRRRKYDAEQKYMMIAVDFLKLTNRPTEAESLEKAIKGYMRKDLKDRLDKLNDSFIGGK